MSLEFIVAGVYESSKLTEPKEGVVGISDLVSQKHR